MFFYVNVNSVYHKNKETGKGICIAAIDVTMQRQE